MKNKEISVSFSYTTNMGNYESAKIQMELSRELWPDEDLDNALDKDFKYLEAKVMDHIKYLKS